MRMASSPFDAMMRLAGTTKSLWSRSGRPRGPPIILTALEIRWPAHCDSGGASPAVLNRLWSISRFCSSRHIIGIEATTYCMRLRKKISSPLCNCKGCNSQRHTPGDLKCSFLLLPSPETKIYFQLCPAGGNEGSCGTMNSGRDAWVLW